MFIKCLVKCLVCSVYKDCLFIIIYVFKNFFIVIELFELGKFGIKFSM